MKSASGYLFPGLFAFMAMSVIQLSCVSEHQSERVLLKQVPQIVDFNFHIKPILSDRCFPCHGPDQNALKAGLRLDTHEGALRQILTSGSHAFVSGNIKKSEAFQRIISLDPEYQMPPPEFQRRLSEFEIALISRWIKQGAEYKTHWAFIPPEKPDLPKVDDASWCKNEIDHFILQKMQENGLRPNSIARKEILLRRATLDLTGLPPGKQDIENFLADNNPDAFEKVIDRLLQSAHFGERMARPWLDLARYADSNGYSQDGLRIMWPWRDWVIKAYNENMPYDQFLRLQVAGDKLPGATQDQILSTGFLRNYRQNGEGGIVDEEYRVEYAADRTETSATVFLGLTMQCARCHDHKYDPISQEDYYQFFSFFNNINERGITANDGNSGPEIVIKTEEVQNKIDFIERQIRAQEKRAEEIASGIQQEEYQKLKVDLNKDLVVDISFAQYNGESFQNAVKSKEKFRSSGNIEQIESSFGQAIKFTAYDWININKKEIQFDRSDPFSLSFFLKLDHNDANVSVLNHLGSQAINYPGYEIAIVDGYPTFTMAHSLPAVLLQVQGSGKTPVGNWVHLTFTYNGSGKASGINLYVDGRKEETNIVFDKLTQGISNGDRALTVGGRLPYSESSKEYGYIDELKIYSRVLSAIEAYKLFSRSINLPVFEENLRKEHYLLNNQKEYAKIFREIKHLRKQKFEIEDTLVSVMVMEDLPKPRATFVLNRGAYDAPTRSVLPATPESVFAFKEGATADRSGLAEWLVDQQNPLTARVAVNRFWQLIFGHGLVKTTEDFGNQGALPTHPALLDWLAVSFMESDWNIKGLLKTILLSATYQQSSTVDAKRRAADPDNFFLARGPATRLTAEQIRDCVLAASGLLNRQIGGPSVKPYQPAGLWEEKGEFSKLKYYVQDTGSSLYRRSLYTFWRRTSPPPSMVTFDAPSRDVCTPARQSTNTPLQALVLQNDPQFVEASRILAERVLREEKESRNQVAFAYQLLTGLTPKPEVLSLLEDLKQKEMATFDQDEVKVKQLMTVGEHPYDQSLNTTEIAAMTVVCNTIMSFDETLVKR